MKTLLRVLFTLVIGLVIVAPISAQQDQPMSIELQFENGGWFTCPATVQAGYPDGYPFGLNNGPDPETPVWQTNCNATMEGVVRVLVDGNVVYEGKARELNPHRWQEEL